ncbi:MAG: tetraacyldisaccharide 4'-kinase [Pseudomonadota bacterium]
MALDEAPPFWWKNPGWQAWLLSPFSFIYGRAAGKRMEFSASVAVDAPVICVGNFIVGGAGKTPTVELLSKHVRARGLRPGVLTRGHGGAITSPTIVRRNRHNAHDVGDEALLHAKHAITVVSADRPSGAELLMKQGCELILMDDGFQNPSLEKDFNLVVVDAKRGLGNGFAMPAGPMRVPFRHQLFHADTILVIGEGARGDAVVRKCAKAGKPIIRAMVKPRGTLPEKPYFAYAGIADTTKFTDTLQLIGADLRGTEAFGDHHFFTQDECDELIQQAKALDAKLITTAKDAERLRGVSPAHDRLLEESEILDITLQVEDPNLIEHIIDVATQRSIKSKLARQKTLTATTQ